MVLLLMPGAPLFVRTDNYARHRTFAVDLVLQRVKRLIQAGLDRPVQSVLSRSDPLASHSRQRGRSTASCAVRHTSYDLGKLRGKLLVDKPEREAALTRSTFTKSTANKPLS